MPKERFKAVVSVHLLLIQDNKVLLLLRKGTGYMDGFYGVVAGHADGNESALDATLREAKEEVNLELSSRDLRFGCVLHRKTEDRESIDFFFTCNEWPQSLSNAEPHKCEKIEFFEVDQLPNNTIPYVVHGIGCCLNGINHSSYGW